MVSAEWEQVIGRHSHALFEAKERGAALESKDGSALMDRRYPNPRSLLFQRICSLALAVLTLSHEKGGIVIPSSEVQISLVEPKPRVIPLPSPAPPSRCAIMCRQTKTEKWVVGGIDAMP